MKVGNSVKTLPTVKPKLYAGKVGTIAVRNEDEVGVLINGKIVWFVEREIEEWLSSTAKTVGPPSRNPANNGHTLNTGLPARNQNREESGAVPDGRVPGPPHHPLTNPPRAVPGSERPSEPRSPSAASRGSSEEEQLILGERGPGGGVVAKCVACGGVWERPKQRGRPSLKCEECR